MSDRMFGVAHQSATGVARKQLAKPYGLTTDDPIRNLIVASIMQAVIDAMSHNLVLSSNASRWLGSQDAQFWADEIGILLNVDKLPVGVSASSRRALKKYVAIKRAKQILEQNPQISLSGLARECGIGTSDMKRFLKTITQSVE